MSNKILLSTLFVFCAAFVFAGDISSYTMSSNSEEAGKVSSVIAQKYDGQKKYASEGSSEDGVLTLKFDIESDTILYDDYGVEMGGSFSNLFDTTRNCSMIRIDENWLIGSTYCFNFERYESEEFSYLESGTSSTIKNIQDIRIDGLRITKMYEDGREIYVNDKSKAKDLPLYISSDIMLLYIGNSAKLKDKYAKLPKSNLYIPSKPEFSVAELKDLKFYVSRKSFVFGVREKQEREVAQYCSDTKCIKIKFGLFHAEAVAGDPLFAVSPNSMEFIVGFNTGDEKVKESQSSSRHFKELSANSFQSIEKIINSKDSASWKRLKTKIAENPNSFIK